MLEVLMSVLGVATIVALVKDNEPLAAGFPTPVFKSPVRK